MFDNFTICPYTGLRSFTEEESIYFKGRDEHILEATKQLEKNKFLMLTGASGDGKSSLVYAGIIPNARSGFLKAKYSNWQVVDFKPERTPMDNLCEALSKGLGINNVATVRAELSHGFSALVDLYKSSRKYFDAESNEYQAASEEGKSALSREAANLIVLADQFEEFFTNPENYHGGVPSTESALVLNILLETARIALDENLPIYVVFTMRSDYIGQCAAFRGLPEYIGFSQFFVPRMNRKQLQEVIEEPAVLSGNSISRRLSERLIEDITDGSDQLPMLQHALNQIWKMADSGKEELDLIHYAMVGGLAPEELPDDERQKFLRWFDELPKKIKVCYDEASLQNVLNTHANILYNHASGYVKSKASVDIDDADAKLILKKTFQCLTKINEGRAVRNRMTLGEITDIINRPGIDNAKVNLVLNAYRDASNTLLKPFIGEKDENRLLDQETVLDISHESLIRNWSQLNEWANEELDDYTVFLDFEQQLQHWLDNERSSDFLLSIGPLTFFETWFNKKEPNQYWIARYDANGGNKENLMKKAEKTLTDARDFLRSSARKHLVTRTVMKYGPKRIAAIIAIVFGVLLSSFTIKTYLERTDSSMRKFFVAEMHRYANDPSIRSLNILAGYMEQLRVKDITPEGVVASFDRIEDKVSYSTGMATWMYANIGSADNRYCLYFEKAADSLLEMANNDPGKDLQFLIREMNDLQAIAVISNYLAPNYGYEKIVRRNAQRLTQTVLEIIRTEDRTFGQTAELNDALEYALNQHAFSANEIEEIINTISPFEKNYTSSSWLAETYPKPSRHSIIYPQLGFNYNGLYQEVAYLYAVQGNTSYVLKALDTLLVYNAAYPNESYMSNIDNALTIAHYFTMYEHPDAFIEFVTSYCSVENIRADEFYENMNSRTKIAFITIQKMSEESAGPLNRHHNANIDLVDSTYISFYHEKERAAIRNSSLANSEKEFRLALNYKSEGLLLSKLFAETTLDYNKDHFKELFKLAIDHYLKVSPDYLNETIGITTKITSRMQNATRRYLFLYPSKTTSTIRILGFSLLYESQAFLEYVIDAGKFKELYESADSEWIEKWLWEAMGKYAVIGFTPALPLDRPFAEKLLDALLELDSYSDQQYTILMLHLGSLASAEGDLNTARTYYSRMSSEGIANILNNTTFGFLTQDVLRSVSRAVRDLYNLHDIQLANDLLRAISNPINRSSIYAYAAMEYVKSIGKDKYVDALIDSSFLEMNRADRRIPNHPNRINLAAALAFRNAPGDIDRAFEVIKNEEIKSLGIWFISRGLAFNDELYNSYKAIPGFLSDDDVCGYLFEVYHNYKMESSKDEPYWAKVYTVGDNSNARIRYIR